MYKWLGSTPRTYSVSLGWSPTISVKYPVHRSWGCWFNDRIVKNTVLISWDRDKGGNRDLEETGLILQVSHQPDADAFPLVC